MGDSNSEHHNALTQARNLVSHLLNEIEDYKTSHDKAQERVRELSEKVEKNTTLECQNERLNDRITFLVC